MALAEPEEDPRKVEIADQVEALLVQRADARLNKDWPLADSIRNQLTELGVVLPTLRPVRNGTWPDHSVLFLGGSMRWRRDEGTRPPTNFQR